MGDIVENSNSLAAPLIFIIVTVVQLIPRYLEQQIKKGSKSDTEVNLRKEIKHLYNEASALSQPSTFAQAAKLRRTAANKEKELSKYMEQHALEKQSIYDPYKKLMTPLKVLTYILLTYWFWATPVASIPKELVQPLVTVHLQICMLVLAGGTASHSGVKCCLGNLEQSLREKLWSASYHGWYYVQGWASSLLDILFIKQNRVLYSAQCADDKPLA